MALATLILTSRVVLGRVFLLLLLLSDFVRAGGVLGAGRLARTVGRHHDHVAVVQPALRSGSDVRYRQRVGVQSVENEYNFFFHFLNQSMSINII